MTKHPATTEYDSRKGPNMPPADLNMPPADLNVADVIRDYAPYQGLAFLPLLAICVISRRRRWLFPLGLTCTVVSWAIVASLLLHRLGGINDASGLGSSRQPRGPFVSDFTIFGIFVFWLVAAILAGLLYPLGRYLVARRTTSAFATLVPISAVLVYALVATWIVHSSVLGDTVVASGFTRAGWVQIAPGQNRNDVNRVLGAPFSEDQTPAFARDQGAECWISHRYTGYFACIWFREGTVAKKELWYDPD